jgi:hypothetical protein
VYILEEDVWHGGPRIRAGADKVKYFLERWIEVDEDDQPIGHLEFRRSEQKGYYPILIPHMRFLPEEEE